MGHQDNIEPIWTELSRTLRALRTTSGVSIRETELRSGIGRGTLSAFETAKARPSRQVVEWYDRAFGGDGLPIAIYAEARGAHGRVAPAPQPSAPTAVVDDEHRIRVEAHTPAAGELVPAGEPLRVEWRLRNVGPGTWRGWRLQRVGPPAAPGLLASEPHQDLADVVPGGVAELGFDVVVPAVDGSLAAYWQLVHEDGVACSADGALLRLVVIARSLCRI